MSRLQRDRYTRKLSELLSRSDDERFVQLLWSIDALQSGGEEHARRFISYLPEAVSDDIGARYAIHKWELETVFNLLLTTPKQKIREGRNRFQRCDTFYSGSNAVSFLRKLENAEFGIFSRRYSVLIEMHRIGHRQLEWQRGFSNRQHFYGYMFLYGGKQCSDYLSRSYGVSLLDLSFAAFGLYATFQSHPVSSRKLHLQQVGLSSELIQQALDILARPIADMRSIASEMAASPTNAPLPVGYRASVLRQYPLITFGPDNSRVRSPLPALILRRITSGVYYDLVRGPSHLRNEAALRFEEYAAVLTKAMLPRLDVARSQPYRARQKNFETPDIRLSQDGNLVLAIECKATKLTLQAQFAEDPYSEAKSGYEEIANGIFQLWRYFSHLRLGVGNEKSASPDVRGMVLTLDAWATLGGPLHEQLLEAANALADREGGITQEDRRAVLITPVSTFESVLAYADEDTLLELLKAASEPK